MPRSALTFAQREKAMIMELDKASMSMLNGSQGITTTPEILTGYDSKTEGILTTCNITTGVITAGRTGTMIVDLTASFELDAPATLTMDVFNSTTDTNYGFQRKVSNMNDVGSAAGCYIGDVTVGDLITIKASVVAGTPTETLENFVVKTSWSD